jgi:hypothetical protein
MLGPMSRTETLHAGGWAWRPGVVTGFVLSRATAPAFEGVGAGDGANTWADGDGTPGATEAAGVVQAARLKVTVRAAIAGMHPDGRLPFVVIKRPSKQRLLTSGALSMAPKRR